MGASSPCEGPRSRAPLDFRAGIARMPISNALMQWTFGALLAVFAVSVVVTLIGAVWPSMRSWVIPAIRLRYLALGLFFLLLGLQMTIAGITTWVDWFSITVGLFVMAIGAVWLYARGGIGPTHPSP